MPTSPFFFIKCNTVKSSRENDIAKIGNKRPFMSPEKALVISMKIPNRNSFKIWGYSPQLIGIGI